MLEYTKNKNEWKTNILNNFLNILAIKLADNYLDSLKKYQAKESNEIILNFLDNIIYLVDDKIDITNQIKNSRIIKMNSRQKEKFDKALSKTNKYTHMCNTLNFIYVIIKEEDKQEMLFNSLYKKWDENENNFLEMFYSKQEQSKYNFFNDLKQKLNINQLISNNLNYAIR